MKQPKSDWLLLATIIFMVLFVAWITLAPRTAS